MGEAFVGPSGRLLDRIIADAGGTSIPSHFTNVVLCRPPENRDPSLGEILACQPNVRRIISNVRPQLTVFVGEFAERYYKKELPQSIRIIHPAALLRKGGVGAPYYRATVLTLQRGLEGLRGML